MPFITACPHCRTSFRAPDQANGKNLRCSKCQKPFLCRKVEAAAPARQPKQSPLLRAAVGGVVLALLIGGAGLAFVWLQNTPRTDPPRGGLGQEQ